MRELASGGAEKREREVSCLHWVEEGKDGFSSCASTYSSSPRRLLRVYACGRGGGGWRIGGKQLGGTYFPRDTVAMTDRLQRTHTLDFSTKHDDLP